VLADAAVESGAELREEVVVEELVWEDDRVVGFKGRRHGGGSFEEHAQVVIGADGVHSLVAKAVAAPEYDVKPPLATYYYSYYSGFDADDVEQYIREGQGAWCFPTHDGLTLIAAVWPSRRFHEVRADVEGHVRAVHESA
jgi:flavin-dependent dehydrogenase